METLACCRYRPWPDLPDPLLEIILERLPTSAYVRFSAVCRRWRSVQTSHRRLHFPSPPPMLRLPWLISSKPKKYSLFCYNTLSCYSPFEDRYFSLVFPSSFPLSSYPKSSFFHGFAHGWFLVLSSDNLILWNPISCFTTTIRIDVPSHIRGVLSFSNVVTISPPPNYTVICIDYLSVFLLRWSDPSWAQLKLSTPLKPITRALTCGGKHYFMSSERSRARWFYFYDVLVIDAMATPASFQLYKMVGRSKMAKRTGRRTFRRTECRHGGPAYFLVFDDELFLVKPIVEHEKSRRGITVAFEVLRADLGTRMWEKVESIGNNRVILIHGYQSVPLTAADIGAKGDSIYFSTTLGDDSGEALWKAFDLRTGRVTDLPLPNASQIKKDHHKLFMPSLCQSSWGF